VEYDGLSTPINLVPSENDWSHMKFDWPTALAELDDGTPLLFKFNLHAGGEIVQTVPVAAIFKA